MGRAPTSNPTIFSSKYRDQGLARTFVLSKLRARARRCFADQCSSFSFLSMSLCLMIRDGIFNRLLPFFQLAYYIRCIKGFKTVKIHDKLATTPYIRDCKPISFGYHELSLLHSSGTQSPWHKQSSRFLRRWPAIERSTWRP